MDALLQGTVTVVTAPAEEPVSLAEAKLDLRVDHSDEDELIEEYITAAREHVENVTWKALVTQTLEAAFDAWPQGSELVLPRPPLQSVASVTYTDSDGNDTVWDSANYIVDTRRKPGRIVLGYGKSWPTATLQPVNGIVVRYVAGYGAESAVPALYKKAIKLLVGEMYEHREATVIAAGAVATELRRLNQILMQDAVR